MDFAWRQQVSIPVGRTKTWNKDGKVLLETKLRAKEEYGVIGYFSVALISGQSF
jgi:hypothetical protein